MGTEIGREVTSEGTAEISHVKGVPRVRDTGEWWRGAQPWHQERDPLPGFFMEGWLPVGSLLPGP